MDKGDEFDDSEAENLMLAQSAGSKRELPSDFDDQHPAKNRKPVARDASRSLAYRILANTWGFPSFKHQQEVVISHLISGGSALVRLTEKVFPTGGGKSLTYQIPALSFDDYDVSCGIERVGGVSLVVSPLIALMKDQVDALKKRGVCAAAMDSSQSRESWLDTCDKLRRNQLKLLYVAPERLNNEGFVEMIQKVKIRLVAIDEAHCISEWGHAFRPDYLKVARFTKEVRAERVLCLTATATSRVTDDICAAFDIEKPGVFRTSMYRPNLRLLAMAFDSGTEKDSALIRFLHDNKGPSIVYVQTQAQTETVCLNLKREGFDAYEYHAGMSTDARTANQNKFMTSKNIIIVATIAFGMGIDKEDIRTIVHYAVPKSLEGYSQEIGRAGRDGLPSTCMVFLCGEDIGIMEEWSRADVPSLRSVRGLLGGLLELYQCANPGEVIERNLNDESRDWDLRRNALDLLNAQLELRFDLIRAITPKYSEYKYVKFPSFEARTADGSKVTASLKSLSKTAKKWTHVDVDKAARESGFSRAKAVRKLQEWNDHGVIELQQSGVIHRFRILQSFPQDEEAKEKVIKEIHAHFEAREKSDMARVQGVIDLITAACCLNCSLSKHFGDELRTPKGCGNCNFCLTSKPVRFLQGLGKDCKGLIDRGKIRAILSATEVRDDPRFLARVAFGISSPRVTSQKLGKHPVFGSMTECKFEELVEEFSKVCE